MTKKIYQAPAMDVVGLDLENRLLTGSGETGSASLGGRTDGGDLNDEW